MNTAVVNAFLSEHGTALDAEGYAAVQCRGLLVNVQMDTSTASLCLYTALGKVPVPLPADMAQMLLAANLLGAATGNGHIGLYTPTQALVFSQRVFFVLLAEMRLEDMFQSFMDHAFHCLNMLGAAETEAPQNAPVEEEVVEGLHVFRV